MMCNVARLSRLSSHPPPSAYCPYSLAPHIITHFPLLTFFAIAFRRLIPKRQHPQKRGGKVAHIKKEQNAASDATFYLKTNKWCLMLNNLNASRPSDWCRHLHGHVLHMVNRNHCRSGLRYFRNGRDFDDSSQFAVGFHLRLGRWRRNGDGCNGVLVFSRRLGRLCVGAARALGSFRVGLVSGF